MKTYSCEKCGKHLQHKSSFSRHKRTCEGPKVRKLKEKVGGKHPCEECGRNFSRIYELQRHKQLLHSGIPLHFLCGMCKTSFSNREELLQHREEDHQLRSKFRLVKTAHKSAVQCFRLDLPDDVQQLHETLAYMKPKVMTLLKYFAEQKNQIKSSLVLSQRFVKATDIDMTGEVRQGFEGAEVITMHFRTNTFTFGKFSTDFSSKVDEMLSSIASRFDDFLQNGSGYVLTESLSVDVEILECASLAGSCDLHVSDHRRGSGLQIRNERATGEKEDNFCFYYAVAAFFLKKKGNLEPTKSDMLSFIAAEINENVEAPVPLKYVQDFEDANQHLELGVNVIFQSEDGLLFPAHASSRIEAKNTINMMLFFTEQTGEDGNPVLHYALVENIDKLMARRGVTSGGNKYTYNKQICFNCFSSFARSTAYANHVKWCHKEKSKRIVTPEPGSKVKYEPKKKGTKAGYVFFFDFETLQRKAEKKCGHSKSDILSHHEAFAYSFIMVNREGEMTEKVCFVGETEEETLHHFLTTIQEMDTKYSALLRQNVEMRISGAEEREFQNAVLCHVCKKSLQTDRVRDHDHLTGKYVGAAHNLCNLLRQEGKRIVGFCHNFSGFDSHFVVKAISAYEGKLRLTGIPLNCEKFKTLTIGNMMLCDSFSFLGSSLSSLVETLKASNHTFPLLKEWLGNDKEKVDSMLRKGVYPYEYITSIERVKENSLPPISEFTSLLSGEISKEDYEHAQKVWDLFECKSMVDYTELYCLADTIQLAEAMLDLRDSIYDEFEVDLAYYLSLPMLSKDLMLKITGCEMELLSDIEQINMIRSGIRGGLSYVSHRYFNCEEEKKKMEREVCLNYLDANNLYGEALKMSLPYDGFKWMSEEELEKLDISSMSDSAPTSCILEVDLSYPEELHIDHSSFPLAPHQMDIDESILSPYAKEALHTLSSKTKHQSQKLTSTFLPRKKYVVHALNLKLYLELGMKLEKIHRGISFNQSKFIAPYIEICSRKRAQAPTKSRSNLYKLLSNSLFGKLIENGTNRMDIRFVNEAKQAKRVNTDPRTKSHLILSENLSVSFLSKKETMLNQSWAVGFSVLDLSKYIMQRLYYQALKPRFKNRVITVLTDTDSFLVALPGKSSDSALRKLPEVMDYSNYPPSHPLFDPSRKNVPGYLKNETAGDEILEVVGVRSKTYAFKTRKDVQSRCKGVKEYVKNKIPFSDFVKVVKELHEVNVEQHTIQSRKHDTRLMLCRKIAFSSFDDKRYSLCSMHTVPYNSILIKKSRGLKNNCYFCENPAVMV